MATGAYCLRVGEEVAAALAGRRRVVALESAVFGGLGLPPLANRERLARCVAARIAAAPADSPVRVPVR